MAELRLRDPRDRTRRSRSRRPFEDETTSPSGAKPRSRARAHRRWRAAAAAALFLLGGPAGRAADSLSLPPPGRNGWKPFSFPGTERITEYAALVVEGLEAVRSHSECSASALILPCEDIDLARTPLLSWQWKVYRPLALANERARAGDDFAARVYVAFRFDEESATVWERIRHAAAEAIYGTELPGTALSYVWSSHEPAGQSWDNPFTSATRMISLGRGEMGGWRAESVDVLGDFRRAMDAEPPPLQFIALMTDSDDSCSAAGAYFADFRFRAAVLPASGRAEDQAALQLLAFQEGDQVLAQAVEVLALHEHRAVARPLEGDLQDVADPGPGSRMGSPPSSILPASGAQSPAKGP